MRDVVDVIVDVMEAPNASLRSEAASVFATEDLHDTFLREWPCLQSIEQQQPQVSLPTPRALCVAAWNMERCKRVEDCADLIRSVGADVVLATEMDIGMARSGQRHTPRELAQDLGYGYAFATEFVELGVGDPFETGLFADVPNSQSLHGNAILSRYPLQSPKVIPLDDTGRWFTGSPKSDGQRRVGGRMAITAAIETAFGPVAFVAVHYESESDAKDRLAQTDVLLAGLDQTHPGVPCVIGGDLNTADLAGHDVQTCLLRPETIEPSFNSFRDAGFDWRNCNDGKPTTRAAPGKPVDYPLKRLDWLFARGLSAHAPETVPAISIAGHYLSDHELVLARIAK